MAGEFILWISWEFYLRVRACRRHLAESLADLTHLLIQLDCSVLFFEDASRRIRMRIGHCGCRGVETVIPLKSRTLFQKFIPSELHELARRWAFRPLMPANPCKDENGTRAIALYRINCLVAKPSLIHTFMHIPAQSTMKRDNSLTHAYQSSRSTPFTCSHLEGQRGYLFILKTPCRIPRSLQFSAS